MNIDELKQELRTIAGQVHATEPLTRLEGVGHKAKRAKRNKTISMAVGVASVVSVAGFTAPQLLAMSDDTVGPADQTVTQPRQTTTTNPETTPPTPQESPWTPIGRQGFIDKPDNRPPAIDIRSVDVTNERETLAVTIHAADLEPGRAALSVFVTDSTDPHSSTYTSTGAYRVDVYLAVDGTMYADLYRSFSDPYNGKAPMRCPNLAADEDTDSRNRIDVAVPKGCIGDIEGPLRVWTELRQPGVEGGVSDELHPQPAVVR